MMASVAKLILKICLYFLLLLIILYLLLTSVAPFFAVHYAEEWFAEQYPGQLMSLNSLEISPLRGRIILQDLTLQQPQQGTIEQLESLSLGAIEIYWRPWQLTEQQFNGKLKINHLRVKAHNAPALSFEQFILSGIDAHEQAQHIQQLTLKGLRVDNPAADDKPLASIEEYQINDIQFDPQSLQLITGAQTYYGLVVEITKLVNGTLEGVPLAATDETSNPEATPLDTQGKNTADTSENTPENNTATAPEKTFSAQIASIQQTHESSSYLHFVDQSVTPNADVRLEIRELNIGAINSAELQQKIPLQLELGLDEYNRMITTATLGLLNDQPEGDIKLTVEQLNMVPFNGYVAQAMGYHVQKGSLNLDMNMTIHQAEMDGKADILLRNSEFVPVDKETIDRLGKQISMPVDTVLSILRDDNNNIKLTMPLSGNLNDPDVGLDDLMNQLSLLALKEAATYYLKQALQPYGTLISLSTYAGKYLFAIRLDDLKYQPMTTTLNEEQHKYLEKVADTMVEKPELELQVCGFASEAEVKALTQTAQPVDTNQTPDTEQKTQAEQAEESEPGQASWQQLAQQRSANVKRWFKIQHEALLPRVTVCQPQQGDHAQVSLGF